ncbi:hypothetical protein [uncultured Chryseobacterium sp.]|uniref:hypothetical protein n=1 Tax=uncultured Chryseobacterium sp. TaxID=259322 RepID=UPI0025D688B5|nr:hypothetical protein [uncultured Chryseobacterium sp.]
MKKYLILLSFFSILSCKKNTDLNVKNNSIEKKNLKNKDSVYLLKKIGVSEIENYDFPEEWRVNTYDDENIQLEKKDIQAQNQLDKIDYFNLIKGAKNEASNINYLNYIRKDSLLNLAKIDSLFLIDSRVLSDNRQIKIFKTIAKLENDNYDVPVNIYKIDLILVNKSNVLNSINIYSEIDFPYATRQNICFLDENGKLFCRKFRIEEEKVINNGSSSVNVKKMFNIK